MVMKLNKETTAIIVRFAVCNAGIEVAESGSVHECAVDIFTQNHRKVFGKTGYGIGGFRSVCIANGYSVADGGL